LLSQLLDHSQLFLHRSTTGKRRIVPDIWGGEKGSGYELVSLCRDWNRQCEERVALKGGECGGAEISFAREESNLSKGHMSAANRVKGRSKSAYAKR